MTRLGESRQGVRVATLVARPGDSLALERSILRGFAVLRWVSVVWVIGVAVYSRHYIRHPFAVIGALVLALSVTLVTTRLATLDTARALRFPIVIADVATALSLYLADGYGFKPDHVFHPGQALTASWPICAVASAGIAFGPAAGSVAGFLMGLGRYVSAVVNGFHGWHANQWSSLANTAVFSAVLGFIAGWVAVQLRRAENELAAFNAREDFARTMHDSVLQTLALVERRTRNTDPALADAAKRTDRELRAYLFAGADSPTETIATGLRRVVDRAILDHELHVELSIVAGDEANEPPESLARAVVAAVGEALTNAAKHAQADKVVVFCDLDDDSATTGGSHIFVSINDDGIGFNRTSIDGSRRGIVGSIEQRMTDVGGRAEIDSAPGKGTEVRIYGP